MPSPVPRAQNCSVALDPAQSEVCPAWSLPCRQRQCWSCSGRPCPRSAGRWISARGCSRSRAPGSCRWCRCSAGTRRRCGTPARGTMSASPSCSLGWCNCWGPSPARSWSVPRTTPHCGCSPAHGAFRLGEKKMGLDTVSPGAEDKDKFFLPNRSLNNLL